MAKVAEVRWSGSDWLADFCLDLPDDTNFIYNSGMSLNLLLLKSNLLAALLGTPFYFLKNMYSPTTKLAAPPMKRVMTLSVCDPVTV